MTTSDKRPASNKLKNNRSFVVHPFLFALYPVLSLLASNLDQISPIVGLRASLTLVFVTALFMLLFWFWMKDLKKAGLAVSTMLFLIFSFNHITNLLGKWEWYLNRPFLTIILLVIFCILILMTPWLVWRFFRSNPDALTKFLNVMGIFIIIFPLIQIGSYILSSPESIEKTSEEDGLINQNSENSNMPDVYYIIVDGYGRADVLQEIYGYDNSRFLDALAERGFYVADQSSANYMQTYLSLSSSLNFDYLDALAPNLGADQDRRDLLKQLIQQNAVRKMLEEAGYETIIYDSNLPAIKSPSDTLALDFKSDANNTIMSLNLNSFESLLWRNTIFKYFTANNRSFDDHRNLILENFSGLKSAAAMEGSQFVIGHVLAPHPPFVFNAVGEPIQPDDEYSIHDGNSYIGSREEYLAGYSGQIAHISTLVLETIDHILAESEQPPIIIIQGDHGPGSTLDLDVLENNSCFKERQTILNAYYFPDGDYDTLYESLTPVNSFRVVLNKLVGSELPLLADKNYFSLWNTPYDFVDITEEVDSCQRAEN